MGVMKYFTPETSKKLEEMGLETKESPYTIKENGDVDMTTPSLIFSTLDICELENAKKLWGDEDRKYRKHEEDAEEDPSMPLASGLGLVHLQDRLAHYVNMSDEERVQYVEVYLNGLINYEVKMEGNLQ
jgi:hypothetical protein